MKLNWQIWWEVRHLVNRCYSFYWFNFNPTQLLSGHFKLCHLMSKPNRNKSQKLKFLHMTKIGKKLLPYRKNVPAFKETCEITCNATTFTLNKIYRLAFPNRWKISEKHFTIRRPQLEIKLSRFGEMSNCTQVNYHFNWKTTWISLGKY